MVEFNCEIINTAFLKQTLLRIKEGEVFLEKHMLNI